MNENDGLWGSARVAGVPAPAVPVCTGKLKLLSGLAEEAQVSPFFNPWQRVATTLRTRRVDRTIRFDWTRNLLSFSPNV